MSDETMRERIASVGAGVTPTYHATESVEEAKAVVGQCMSATEELRRLLDERGVEWTAPKSTLRDIETIFFVGDTEWTALERYNGFVELESEEFDLTPKQAIEATLGRGECSITRDFKCSACGHQYPKTNCEPYETCDGRQAWKSFNYWVLACDTPNYCPDCGRKVVEQ